MIASLNEQVVVYPFTRQPDGEEINIGRADGATFLALPPAAIGIIDDLANGSTIGEAQVLYQKRHGELVDVAGLVEALETEGFVRRASAKAVDGRGSRKSKYLVNFHCTKFPQSWGQRIYSRPVLIIAVLLVVGALIGIARSPGILPGPEALYFSSRLGTAMLWLAPLFALQICLHELSHMAAARSLGVPVRFGVSHRLWLLVLETDMSGIWTLPRNQRYLPMLAGSLLDIVTASALVLALVGERHHLIALSSNALGILRALVVIYAYQILWQCFMFLRTDFYYAVANLFGCKNLMADTKTFLHNICVRIARKGTVHDQSNLPSFERRVIRWYSIPWIVGRALALYVLIFMQIPLVGKYLKLIWRAVTAMFSGKAMVSPAILLPVVMSLFTFFLGMFLWIRSMRSSRQPAPPNTLPSA
jgi:hypothetical protein